MKFSLVWIWKFDDVWMEFAAAAPPPPPAPSAYIAQAQQRYQDATQSRNLSIVDGPSAGSDRRLIREDFSTRTLSIQNGQWPY